MKKLALLSILLVTLAACQPQGENVAQIEPTATFLPILSLTPRFTATPESTRTPLPTFTFTPTLTLIPPTASNTPSPTMTPTITGIIQSMQRVNVREGPGVSFSAIAALAPGTGVQVLGRNFEGDWINIRMEDGSEGWVATRLLFLPPTATPFPSPTPSPDLTRLFLGTPLPTAILGGQTITPTPPVQAVSPTPPGTPAPEETPPETPQSFLPVVDMQAINATATALAAGAATSTPRATTTPEDNREITVAAPPTSATSESTSTGSSDGGITEEQARALAGVDVFAFCSNRAYGIPAPSNLAAGSTIDIYWAWFARTEEQVRQHIDAATHELRVNGVLIENVNQFRTRVRRSAGEGSDFVTYWYVPFGPLTAGNYEITYTVSWARQITDGYLYYGPGTSIPFEQERCAFTVR